MVWILVSIFISAQLQLLADYNLPLYASLPPSLQDKVNERTALALLLSHFKPRETDQIDVQMTNQSARIK